MVPVFSLVLVQLSDNIRDLVGFACSLGVGALFVALWKECVNGQAQLGKPSARYFLETYLRQTQPEFPCCARLSITPSSLWDSVAITSIA